MSHDSTKTCKFPAFSIRSYRSALVAEIAQMDKSGEGGSTRQQAIMKTVMAIDKLYGDHQAIDGCSTCWWTAAETSIFAGLL